MAILRWIELLFLSMHFTVDNGDHRTFRDVYQPYGPKMCAKLTNDLKQTLDFVTEDLSCRFNSTGDSENRKRHSFPTCAENEMGKNNNKFDWKICDPWAKDERQVPFLPHSNTHLKPSTDVQPVNISCTNLLHEACEKGEVCTVRYILSHGWADINCREKWGKTPVMSASRHGHVDIVYFLIGQDCDLSNRDVKNNTVLHVACVGGNIDIVRELVVNVKLNIESKGQFGQTPVLISAYFGHKEVLKFLAGEDCNMKVVDNHGKNILHLACINGKVDVVKYILSQEIIDIESRERNEMTPVLEAANNGHVAVVKLLKSSGCDMRAVDFYKDNILHKACIGGHVEMVEYLLSKQKVDTESRNKFGRTPVMAASWAGHVAIVSQLRRFGCGMRAVDSNNDTVLHAACIGGKTGMVKYILSLQIIDVESRDNHGRTPVITASHAGQVAAVKYLRSKDCNMRAIDDFKYTVLHAACIGGKFEMVKYILSLRIIDIESRDRRGKTAVMLVSHSGHKDIFELLISNDCDMKVVDYFNDTVLHEACSGGKTDIVKYILSRKIIDIDSRGRYGRTPVMLACGMGQVEVVKLLLSKGCDMNVLDIYNDTILHVACFRGTIELVAYILSMKTFDINIRGADGWTPVMRASQGGHVAVVKLLEDRGCDMRAVDDNKVGILHEAAGGGHVEMVKYILSRNIIDINSRGEDGITPVMNAAKMGQKEIVKYLKDEGCNMVAQDYNLNNILHLACMYGHEDVVKYLIQLEIPDRNQRNRFGHTPLQTALLHDQQKVFHLLQ